MNTIFDIKDIFYVILGGFLFSIPYAVNLFAKHKEQQCKKEA